MSDAAAAPRTPWRSRPTAVWGLSAAAVVLATVAGAAGALFPGAFHVEPSALHGVLLVGYVLAGALIVRRPVVGLVALVGVVYLHLSDVLVRFHGLPSVLQLLAIPLLLAVLVEWREEIAEGLSPWTMTVALAAYVFAFALSTLVAEDTALADGRTLAAAEGFVLYVLVLLLASSAERVRAGAWVLVCGGNVLGGIALFQVVAGEYGTVLGGLGQVKMGQLYGTVMEPRIAGPVGDPNFFAQVLVIVVPLALVLAWKERSRWLRLAALGAAAVAAGGVVSTFSRGGALALGTVVVLSLFAARPSRRRMVVGAALVLGGLLLMPGDVMRRMETLTQLLPGGQQAVELDPSFQNRILQARVAGRMFVDHPLLGVGAGNYTVHFSDYAAAIGSPAPEYHWVDRPHFPHNLYLGLAAQTGFPGLVAFGAAMLITFGYLSRAGRAFFGAGRELFGGLASGFQIALLGFLVSSLFLHGHYQQYLWILLGLSAALAREAPGASALGVTRPGPVT